MSTHELTLDADHEALRAIGPWLDEVGVPEADRGGIELGVHELAVNSVDHAQDPDGRVVLRARIDGTTLIVDMVDAGVEFEPASVRVPDPDVPQVRGYGLMILEQLADEVTYQRVDEQNRWRVRFALSLDADHPTSRG